MKEFFIFEFFKMFVEKVVDKFVVFEVFVKFNVVGISVYIVVEGNGLVNVFDNVFWKVFVQYFFLFVNMYFFDYKVCVFDEKDVIVVKVCVLIEFKNIENIWNMVGVFENVIEVSWEVFVYSFCYVLFQEKLQDELNVVYIVMYGLSNY